MSRERLLSEAFVELADTLVDEFDALDFLQNLTVKSIQILGSDAGAIVLNDQRGELQVVTSSTHAANDLEVVALASREGPCLDAVATARPVVNTSPEEARHRWPDFNRAALAAGVHGVHVFPMRLRTEVIGAMSLMWRAQHRLDQDDIAIASALTSVATMSLLHERTARQREVLAEQLHRTLNDRVVLEQAKGVVAEILFVDVADAFALMSDYSRARGESLTRVARDVLARPFDVTELLREA